MRTRTPVYSSQGHTHRNFSVPYSYSCRLTKESTNRFPKFRDTSFFLSGGKGTHKRKGLGVKSYRLGRLGEGLNMLLNLYEIYQSFLPRFSTSMTDLFYFY